MDARQAPAWILPMVGTEGGGDGVGGGGRDHGGERGASGGVVRAASTLTDAITGNTNNNLTTPDNNNNGLGEGRALSASASAPAWGGDIARRSSTAAKRGRDLSPLPGAQAEEESSVRAPPLAGAAAGTRRLTGSTSRGRGERGQGDSAQPAWQADTSNRDGHDSAAKGSSAKAEGGEERLRSLTNKASQNVFFFVLRRASQNVPVPFLTAAFRLEAPGEENRCCGNALGFGVCKKRRCR